MTDTELAEIGLPIAKTPTRATTPPAVCENLRLDHGANPGEVLGKCQPPAGNIRHLTKANGPSIPTAIRGVMRIRSRIRARSGSPGSPAGRMCGCACAPATPSAPVPGAIRRRSWSPKESAYSLSGKPTPSAGGEIFRRFCLQRGGTKVPPRFLFFLKCGDSQTDRFSSSAILVVTFC